MNSNFNNFDFDLAIGSNNRTSVPLNQHNNNNNNNNNKLTNPSYSHSQSNSTSSSFSQPRKPSWTHQPGPSQTRTELGGPPSMVGDITGKSWNSTVAPRNFAVANSIGIVNKNPNLFGDLVSSAIGQGKSSGNVPLKGATAVKSTFSMGGVAGSLPYAGGYGNVGCFNTANSLPNAGGTNMNKGGVSSSLPNASGYGNVGSSNPNNRGGNVTHTSVNKGTGFGGKNSNNDPFGSLNSFSSKPMASSVGSVGKAAATPTVNFDFGGFENGSKPNQSTFSSGKSVSVGANVGSVPKLDSGNDWAFDSGFGGGSTTELDGLPPPPAGVSAMTAKSKGFDNYKQGQYADAIKWLSWAEVLLEKAGEGAGAMEVLSCRASCYKEVGEYKKAVGDCTKVLDHDGQNVAVLVQRALLYESMEKYRLGADDLRTVMKIDPGNRVARSTIHRLNKMADQ